MFIASSRHLVCCLAPGRCSLSELVIGWMDRRTDRQTDTLYLPERENLSSTLLCSVVGAYKLNWHKTEQEKKKFNYILNAPMRVHKEIWLKKAVRIWSLYTILIVDGDGQKGTFGKTKRLFLEGGEKEHLWKIKWFFGKTSGVLEE